MLTVATVLRSGGVYDATWVTRLKVGVSAHLPIAHRFVCFSDVDVPCSRVPLEHGWPGWWSKIEVFRFPGPVLFFDLDTLIVGDLTDIANAAMESPFVMLRDFYRPNGMGSGVMGWSGLDVSTACLYDSFCRDPEGWQRRVGGRGDQGFIEDIGFLPGIRLWQDIVPDQIVSYKAHRCYAGIPRDARVVCLHGRPKFGDMPANDPVRVAWESAA